MYVCVCICMYVCMYVLRVYVCMYFRFGIQRGGQRSNTKKKITKKYAPGQAATTTPPEVFWMKWKGWSCSVDTAGFNAFVSNHGHRDAK